MWRNGALLRGSARDQDRNHRELQEGIDPAHERQAEQALCDHGAQAKTDERGLGRNSEEVLQGVLVLGGQDLGGGK